MSVELIISTGLAVYSANALVGVLAWLRGRRFGVAHHVLYAVNFIMAGVTTYFSPGAPMFVVLACLALMPKTDPRRPGHRWVASVGQVAYIIAWCQAWGAQVACSAG